DGDQGVIARVTRGGAPPDRSMTLREAAGRSISWEQAAAAVSESVRSAWGSPTTPRADQVEAILERAAASSERFRSDGWIWAGAAGR
ncbi:MAG TPA: hypothetical protein VJQ46_12055, partial [Gemmatimonadales bacterium]|nr:hypothetical protein [Gemmatimonadales bacterium]